MKEHLTNMGYRGFSTTTWLQPRPRLKEDWQDTLVNLLMLCSLLIKTQTPGWAFSHLPSPLRVEDVKFHNTCKITLLCLSQQHVWPSNPREGAGEREQGRGSRGEGAREREQGSGSRGEGAGEREQGRGSKGEGAGEREQGRGSRGEGAGEWRGVGAGEWERMCLTVDGCHRGTFLRVQGITETLATRTLSSWLSSAISVSLQLTGRIVCRISSGGTSSTGLQRDLTATGTGPNPPVRVLWGHVKWKFTIIQVSHNPSEEGLELCRKQHLSGGLEEFGGGRGFSASSRAGAVVFLLS